MPNRKGLCTLCGKGGRLTFEHVPPAAAFNQPGVEMYGFDQWLARDRATGAMSGGQPQPRGTGLFALCGTCNPFLGREYVNDFRRFATIGLALLHQIAGKLAEIDADPVQRKAPCRLVQVDRLRVAKQIVSMLVVTSGRRVAEAQPDLVDFVRRPERIGLPARYRLFIGLNAGPALCRSSGLFGRMDAAGVPHSFSEFAYVPWFYLIAYDGGAAFEGLGEVTDWCHAEPGAVDVDGLVVPIGFIHTLLPGVIASRAGLDQRAAANLAQIAPALTEGDDVL